MSNGTSVKAVMRKDGKINKANQAAYIPNKEGLKNGMHHGNRPSHINSPEKPATSVGESHK